MDNIKDKDNIDENTIDELSDNLKERLSLNNSKNEITDDSKKRGYIHLNIEERKKEICSIKLCRDNFHSLFRLSYLHEISIFKFKNKLKKKLIKDLIKCDNNFTKRILNKKNINDLHNLADKYHLSIQDIVPKSVNILFNQLNKLNNRLKKNQKESNKNDSIWEHIIKLYEIDLSSNNTCTITSEQIKDARASYKCHTSQFEPRLLCKMDTNESRPSIFKKYNRYIIPIEFKKWLIIKNNIYINLECYKTCPNIIINKCDSLILKLGNSEMSMLDKLLYNNIFDNIIGEKVEYGPLLGGRHRCSFETNIDEQTLYIKSCQYETDAVYETENNICIVEAKNIEVNNFNIRQLYFPFRPIYDINNNKKNIIALFIYKDKSNIIHIFKYKWNNYKKILDIKNIGYYTYINN